MDPLESIVGGPPASCRTDLPLAEDGPTPRAGCRAVAESSREGGSTYRGLPRAAVSSARTCTPSAQHASILPREAANCRERLPVLRAHPSVLPRTSCRGAVLPAGSSH